MLHLLRREPAGAELDVVWGGVLMGRLSAANGGRGGGLHHDVPPPQRASFPSAAGTFHLAGAAMDPPALACPFTVLWLVCNLIRFYLI